MPVNKVEYCGKVLLDLTEDSVTPENLVEGVTAHGKNGERLVGTNPYAKAETDAVVTEQTDLIEQIMAAVDNLPEAGGVELPELDNPASADDIVEGKEAISGLGEKLVGTNPYAKAETDMVVDEQTDLIEQIRDAVDGLPEAEDVTEETNAYTDKITSLEAAVTALESELAGKAGEDMTSETNEYTSKIALLETAVAALESELAGKAGSSSGAETISVTHHDSSAASHAWYFNSSYELMQISRDSTVSALGGIIMYFGTYTLSAISGDYTLYNTGAYGSSIIKFNADGGSFKLVNTGGADD